MLFVGSCERQFACKQQLRPSTTSRKSRDITSKISLLKCPKCAAVQISLPSRRGLYSATYMMLVHPSPRILGTTAEAEH